MRRVTWIVCAILFALCVGCLHKHTAVSVLHPTAAGSALVESSGGKQLGSPGTTLTQLLIVQVNDKQGKSVTSALVSFSAPGSVIFDPPQILTDSSGQASTQVTLGGTSGRYELTASSIDADGKAFVLNITELAAGYEQELGHEIEENYCARCHDPESTAQRVSNYDNLSVKPHPFTEGEFLNKLSDSDLVATITHGGQSTNGSPLMPPFGSTLTKTEVQALIAYIRLVSDSPYKPAGVVYAKR